MNVFQSILLSFVLCFATVPALADQPVKGNGKLVTKTNLPNAFSRIVIDTYCNVLVTCGSMPRVEVHTDENIHPVLKVRVSGNTLRVSTTEWLQPTKLQLKVYVPYITSFSNSGWGRVAINNLKTREFSLKARTGTVTLQGEVEVLNIKSGTGTIAATSLAAKTVNINSGGFGNTAVLASAVLNVVGDAGNIHYYGAPKLNVKGPDQLHVQHQSTVGKADKAAPLEYVKFSIQNTTEKTQQYVIRGPAGHPFSYGFPLRPGQTRTKTKPVGTKIYTESVVGGRGKLVLVITPEVAGKTITLSN